jgi:formate/nitrite transporter FocA (FNT family)
MNIDFEKIYKSFLAGVMIGLGAYANAKVGGIYGSVLFSVGLISVIRFSLPLYTGLVSKRKSYDEINNMLFVLAMNFLGAAVMSLIALDSDIDKVSVALEKLDKSVLQVIFDSIVCGLCVSIAVKAKNILVTILAVSLFVICGGEHCVADMFIMSFTQQPLPLKSLLFFVMVILGNTLGGLIMLDIGDVKK